jgi:hypothetical protein
LALPSSVVGKVRRLAGSVYRGAVAVQLVDAALGMRPAAAGGAVTTLARIRVERASAIVSWV